MYLTENMPGNSNRTGAAARVYGGTAPPPPPDVRQKLEGYQNEFKSYLNAPPLIRPLPMEKYGVEKPPEMSGQFPVGSRRTVDSENINKRDISGGKAQNTSVNVASYVNSLLEALPKVHKSKGRQLIPHLLRLNILDLNSGEQEADLVSAKNLLYDLVVKSAKRIRSLNNLENLNTAVRKLTGDPLVDKRLFASKLSPHQGDEASTSSHKPERSHPKRSRVLSTPAYYSKHYYQGRAAWT